MADDDGLDELMGDEPDQPYPDETQSTEYGVGSRANRKVIGIVAAVVVLIVAAGVSVGITVGHHHKSSPSNNTVNTLPVPEPTVTVTITATPTASTSASASPSATASPTASIGTGTSSGQASRVRTFYAYYDAINAKDWATVWSLGGKNLDSSYDAMVAGYGNTAKDVPYLVGFNGDQLDLKLLAFKTNGSAQLYSGALTIQHGVIVRGQQTLSYADSNDSFGALAGDWFGHDRDLEITPGGLGVISYRTFKNCPILADGCDQFVGNNIINGATTVFSLDGGQANSATGHVTFSTVPGSSSVTLTQNQGNDTVNVNLVPNAPFCGTSAAQGTCGA